MAINIRSFPGSVYDTGRCMAVDISDDEFISRDATGHAILIMIAEKVAERYVEEHFAEIAAKLDQNAIANLAIAEASQRIAKVVHQRPVMVEPVHRTTVNNIKRSIF